MTFTYYICPFCTAKTVVQFFFHTLWGPMPQPHPWLYLYTRFLGQSPSRQTFSWILGYRDLRERWMRESRCYFSVILPKSGGYGTPHSEKWGVRVPPVSYAYEA